MDEKIFEKFSESARSILVASQQLAESMNSPLGSVHVLLALVLNRGTFANEILREYDINLDQIKLILGLQNIPLDMTAGTLTEDAQSLLMQSIKLAAEYRHVSVDAEHLLLAMASTTDLHAHEVIERLGVNPDHLKRQIQGLFDEIAEIDQIVRKEDKQQKKSAKTKGHGKTKTPALDYFTVDLTKKALNNELDPLIGRQEELDRAIQILSRRTKNNPLLVGEPGVGKTAIVEGLAQRIVAGTVPTHLLGKRLISLDLTLLVAGTMYRGQFEERVKKVIEEIKSAGDIILFIDEIHTIIGAGSAEGSLDAANILKPALTQGWVRLVGATTNEEYRKHIKKDAAFERRLQMIKVDEPTHEQAVAILQGLRPHYESHHGVSITDVALEAAVSLSARYIPDQYLPDKAIDLIDEAAAATQVKHDKKTTGLKYIRKIARLNREKDEAVATENYQLASQLKEQIDALNQRLNAEQQAITPTVRPTIDDTTIARLLSKTTGIPVTNMIKSERSRYAQLDAILRQHIIGQDEAIAKIANAVKRSRIGIASPNRPIGSFMFLGPTGVGKTELAKVLAREIFGNEKALVKIDMSDFMERHNTSRLVGAPAGYVGYEDGGKLTEAIRRQPYSVVLFDEIEKAHPDVFNLLLQLLDEGHLLDAKGQAINFRNTIIILTSNLGMAELTRQAVIGFDAKSQTEEERAAQQYERVKNSVTKTLKDQFRPEFLNRLDHVIVFQPLGKKELHQITTQLIDELRQRIQQLGYELQVTEELVERLAELGHDPANGARPLRRTIAEHLELPIADYLLTKSVQAGSTLHATHTTDGITIRHKRPAKATNPPVTA